MTRRTVVVFLLGVTVARVTGQASDFALRKFGSLSVSDAEAAQITDLVMSTGKRPWLLRSLHTMQIDLRIADLFLEPDTSGARVQRGRSLTLEAEGERFVPPRTPWRIRQTYPYAYIPTPGRLPGEIRSERDTDWPFTVQGEFDDETLISLIEFIRSGPKLPILHKDQANRELRRDVPVSVIARRVDSIFVGLRTGDMQGENTRL